jgi:hypothetical protein
MNYAETTGVERDTCSYWLTLFSEHKSVEPTRITLPFPLHVLWQRWSHLGWVL